MITLDHPGVGIQIAYNVAAKVKQLVPHVDAGRLLLAVFIHIQETTNLKSVDIPADFKLVKPQGFEHLAFEFGPSD